MNDELYANLNGPERAPLEVYRSVGNKAGEQELRKVSAGRTPLALVGKQIGEAAPPTTRIYFENDDNLVPFAAVSRVSKTGSAITVYCGALGIKLVGREADIFTLAYRHWLEGAKR